MLSLGEKHRPILVGLQATAVFDDDVVPTMRGSDSGSVAVDDAEAFTLGLGPTNCAASQASLTGE
jgi:hypothetical protein